jgi:hypothetical protein
MLNLIVSLPSSTSSTPSSTSSQPLPSPIRPILITCPLPLIVSTQSYKRCHRKTYLCFEDLLLATPPPRSGPHALTSIGDFLAQHYSPQTFSNAPTPPANRSDQTNESGNNNNNNSHNSENSSNPFILTPAQPAQGAFSFTFGSRNSNPIHNNSQPPSAQRRLSADPARPSADERTPNEDRSTLGTPPTPPAQPMNGILS